MLELIQAIYERATNPDLKDCEIQAALEPLKTLSAQEACKLAKDFGIIFRPTTKKDAIARIYRRVQNRKEVAGLIDF